MPYTDCERFMAKYYPARKGAISMDVHLEPSDPLAPYEEILLSAALERMRSLPPSRTLAIAITHSEDALLRLRSREFTKT